MELDELVSGLDYVGSSGVTLSTEQRTALRVSLLLLKNAEKFRKVYFWGKVTAGSRDYFVAQGETTPLGPKKNFYSTDCVTWAQLPTLHPLVAASALRLTGLFTGNVSNEYTVKEKTTSDQPSPAELSSIRQEVKNEDGSKTITTTITEDKRLAAVVSAVEFDVAVVPFGAFKKTTAGAIEQNRTFEGLSTADAGKLSSYYHARPAINLAKKSRAEKAKLDQSLGFLDPISEDTPQGTWSIQFDNGSEVAILRSLTWSGFVAYHAPGSTKFGYVYQGNGTKNIDLAFMLP